MRLADLKEQAQEHYRVRLVWHDSHEFGGSAQAYVDGHVVSVMVEPPPGNPHIARVWPGRQEPIVDAPEITATLDTAYQLAMDL